MRWWRIVHRRAVQRTVLCSRLLGMDQATGIVSRCREDPGRSFHALALPPCSELPTVMTFVKHKCVEMMAYCRLGLDEIDVRGGSPEIDRRQPGDRIAALGPSPAKAFNQ